MVIGGNLAFGMGSWGNNQSYSIMEFSIWACCKGLDEFGQGFGIGFGQGCWIGLMLGFGLVLG